jgi:hypothetical protein
MLLRNRAPGIDQRPATTTKGFEHVSDGSIAVLRWLVANRVDFVLVGAVARAVRGDTVTRGPVAIVPAPYGRNLDRLAKALWSAHARLRVDLGSGAGSGLAPAEPDTVPIKMTAEKLVRSERWSLRCGNHDLDIEGRPAGVPRYQELLYEAARFTLAEDLLIEVAAPEDIEHYDHVRRTGASPEIRVSRTVRDPGAS